ncbi:cytochrome c oxidase subunit 6a, mitochondrial-like [Miscanthus floridulus]|uniref:cytochrome c oxidase subunit 6a, mitochondrial-like n=1 Tax=Miscanthus floridulus TaxID=154761 RepID=UPI00345A63FF
MAAPMACFLAAGNAATKRCAGTALRRRGFASSAARHDDAKEAVKWERITYAGIATCTVLAVYNLSKGHQEFPDPPPYPYLHIRNKDFPWGPDGLFERKKKHSNDHH